jgi:hypothetical protein
MSNEAPEPVANRVERVEGMERMERVERIERIGALIVREVSLVRVSNAESLAVVLRPDPETELLVQISRRGGQLEAEIRCDRGDLAVLNGHWHQLRDSLAEHHVRLLPYAELPPAPVDSSAGTPGRSFHLDERASGRHESPSEAGGHNRRDAQRKEPADEAPRPGSPPARAGVRRDHWETWA